VQSLIASVGFTGVLIGLLLTPFELYGEAGAQTVPLDYPRWLKLPLWIAAGAIIVACLLGYVALGRFLAQQLMMTGVIALVATLLFLAIRAFTRESSSGRNPISLFLEEQIGLDATRRRQLAWVTESLLTLALALIALRCRHPRLGEIDPVRLRDRAVQDFPGPHRHRHPAVHGHAVCDAATSAPSA
jgi:potassium efflux system protein